MTKPGKPDRLPAGTTPEGDGIASGTGRVGVDAYIDFLCPYCQRFELAAGPDLDAMSDAGQITLVYHPMNFLDEASTTRYSSRAAAASGCASDQGRFRQYARELFVSQPPEGGAGLTDADLVELGREAGLDLTAFGHCVAEHRYLDWPGYVTARAAHAGIEATPTILVAGTPVRPDAESIAAAVRSGPAER